MPDTPMAAIIATFQDPDEAAKWLHLAHDSDYDVSEGIVITRDEETGKIHKHLARLPGIGAGAGVGAVVGALLGALFPPAILGEALVGAIGVGAAGAAVGAGSVAVKDEIVDRTSFKEVADGLQPGESALVLVMPLQDATEFDAELSGHLRKSFEELAV